MNQSRYVALIISIVAPAVIGGWLGWNYPHFSFPVLDSNRNTTSENR
jgi:hypothetical protein